MLAAATSVKRVRPTTRSRRSETPASRRPPWSCRAAALGQEARQAALVEPALAVGAEARLGEQGKPAPVARGRLRAVMSLKIGLGSHAGRPPLRCVPERRDPARQAEAYTRSGPFNTPREPGATGRFRSRPAPCRRSARRPPSRAPDRRGRVPADHREGGPGGVGGPVRSRSSSSPLLLVAAQRLDLGDLGLDLHELRLDRPDLGGERLLGELSGAHQLVGALAQLLQRGPVLALQQAALALDAGALQRHLDVRREAAGLLGDAVQDLHGRLLGRRGARRTGLYPCARRTPARLPARRLPFARAGRAYRRPMVRRGRGQAAVESVGITVAVALLVAAMGLWVAQEVRPPPRPPDVIGRSPSRSAPAPARGRRRGRRRRSRRGSAPSPVAAAARRSATRCAASGVAWRRPACWSARATAGSREGSGAAARARPRDPPRSPGRARRPARSRAPHAGGPRRAAAPALGRPGRLRPHAPAPAAARRRAPARARPGRGRGRPRG